MAPQATHLLLPDDLEDVGKPSPGERFAPTVRTTAVAPRAHSSSAPPHRAVRYSSSDAIAERAHLGLLRMPSCGRDVPMSPVPCPVIATLITQQKGTATMKLTTQTTSLSMA
jgi:hypothetical protein